MKRNISLLLVDDDIDDQEIFLMTVDALNAAISCSTASNGEDALRILNNPENAVPDFIFLDVNMPRMNGLQCLENIRNNKAFDRCGIYMYSTTAEEHVVEKSRKLNAGFIVKPIHTNDLKERLRTIFGL